MITEKMQNAAWKSLPKDFKKEVKDYYNAPCHNMGRLHVLDTLDSLFGIGNLTEDEQKKEEEKERKLYEELKRKYGRRFKLWNR